MSGIAPSTPLSTTRKASWAKFLSPKTNAEGETKTQTSTNIKHIEKIVGFVSDEYDCIHNNFSGTLYAGPLAVVWLGRIFFFEWTVIIKWEDVTQVQKQTDGVTFHTRNSNMATYDFKNVFNPERVWSNLVSLHNDAILDRPSRRATPRQLTRSLRRMNSDPLKMAMVFDYDGMSTVMPETEHATKETSVTLRPRVGVLTRSVSVPTKEDSDAEECPMPRSSGSPIAPRISGQQLDEQWSRVIDPSSTLDEVAVEEFQLPCDLGLFIDSFVADNATYSISSFMNESGDDEIKCSPWLQGEDGVTYSRTIEYTHPVSAPMAPPMARARKEQSYRIFEEKGMILETKTYVADVPMTDCFFVKDRILIQAVTSGILVTMSFEIQFVKQTMFQSLIARTTKGEIEKFMKKLSVFMSRSLGDASVIMHSNDRTSSEERVSAAFNLQVLIVTLLLTIALLQAWVIHDIRNMKQELVLIHTSHGVCQNVQRNA